MRIMSDDQSNLLSKATDSTTKLASIDVSLTHACHCLVKNCQYVNCLKLKTFVEHLKRCPERSTCTKCKPAVHLFRYHATQCTINECNVPFCHTIKRKIAEKRNSVDEFQVAAPQNIFEERRQSGADDSATMGVNMFCRKVLHDNSGDTSEWNEKIDSSAAHDRVGTPLVERLNSMYNQPTLFDPTSRNELYNNADTFDQQTTTLTMHASAAAAEPELSLLTADEVQQHLGTSTTSPPFLFHFDSNFATPPIQFSILPQNMNQPNSSNAQNIPIPVDPLINLSTPANPYALYTNTNSLYTSAYSTNPLSLFFRAPQLPPVTESSGIGRRSVIMNSQQNFDNPFTPTMSELAQLRENMENGGQEERKSLKRCFSDIYPCSSSTVDVMEDSFKQEADDDIVEIVAEVKNVEVIAEMAKQNDGAPPAKRRLRSKETKAIVDAAEEDLTCCVCLKPFETPVLCLDCKKITGCKKCVDSCKPHCPTCRGTTGTTVVRGLDKLVAKLRAYDDSMFSSGN